MKDKAGGQPGLELLRCYECYCYQTAYYLLGNEADALAAAGAALLELAADPGLGMLSEPEVMRSVRRAVSYQSLYIRKQTVPAV